MRTLKFRVYIPEHEKFSYFELGNFDYSDRYLHQHDYPVQQFTGLKDSKGVDVYEGDLLEFVFQYNGNLLVREVRYFEKFGSFGAVIDKEFETFQDLNAYAQGFNVVGNIFENENI